MLFLKALPIQFATKKKTIFEKIPLHEAIPPSYIQIQRHAKE